MTISPSPFAPEKLVSRDGFSHPVPRQPVHSPYCTQAESGALVDMYDTDIIRGGANRTKANSRST